MAVQKEKSRSNPAGKRGSQTNPESSSIQPEYAAHLRGKLHDGLCQQLAGTALLQAALVNRLEKLGQPAAGSDPPDDVEAAWRKIIADARQVGELLHDALEETRTFLRELG